MAAQGIEGIIGEVLTGDAQRLALDFIAFLNANEIPFTASDNYLDVHFMGNNVCSVLIIGTDDAPGPWTIWSDQVPGTWITWSEDGQDADPADVPVDEQTRQIAWAHVNPCADCGGDCSPGKRKTVLGKAFDGLCSSALAFTNPDADALACAKQMIEARKQDILAKA